MFRGKAVTAECVFLSSYTTLFSLYDGERIPEILKFSRILESFTRGSLEQVQHGRKVANS
ncbi:uncharacterized protein G2W53_017254 [Senna tora]|uniref:Uncharacterized protein n=1 Tax=Senna tora TaxID=362788 RepID=A0A834TTI6_9FABA|nr:uncharacterized protein G2W53_017254 [Senna tora]